MKIHPKLAGGLFIFFYCGIILLIDKLLKINVFQTKAFFITLLIGGEIVYIFFNKKYKDDS
jgi:hypothetical protein